MAQPMISEYGPDGQLVYRPATSDEQADIEERAQTFAAAELAAARTARSADVLAVLNDSDRYLRIAFETGTTMTPAQLAYRQQLRDLLHTIAVSDDPNALELPDPPTSEGG